MQSHPCRCPCSFNFLGSVRWTELLLGLLLYPSVSENIRKFGSLYPFHEPVTCLFGPPNGALIHGEA